MKGRQLLGLAMVVIGLATAGVGVAGLLGEGAGSPPAPSSTTGVSHPLPSVTEPTPTTTSPPTTSTTTSPSTTSPPAMSVETFLVEYAAALDRDDIDFLLGRLHPVVVSAYGIDLCRDWIEREIVTLDGYRLTGAVTGPTTGRVTVPDGETVIEDVFSAPVRFVFEGSTFDREAGFALIDDEVFWLGVCR